MAHDGQEVLPIGFQEGVALPALFSHKHASRGLINAIKRQLCHWSLVRSSCLVRSGQYRLLCIPHGCMLELEWCLLP